MGKLAERVVGWFRDLLAGDDVGGWDPVTD